MSQTLTVILINQNAEQKGIVIPVRSLEWSPVDMFIGHCRQCGNVQNGCTPICVLGC